VIFVVGARRSGTNWLERILTGHPDVVALPTETYLFSHGIKPFSELFQHANPSAPTIGRTFMPRDAFLDAIRDLTDRILVEAAGRDARYIVERTPWHASQLRLIADIYPDAHVINIVRDGRAVARSLVAMPWGPTTIEAAAAEWRSAVTDAQEGPALLGDRFHHVKYEALFADPRRWIETIFGWLDLDLSEETWERILGEAGAAFNVDPGSPGLSADKWRTELSARDLRAIEQEVGDQLDALGYPRAADARRTPGLPSARQTLSSLGPRVRELRHTGFAAVRSRDRPFARRLHADQVANKEAAGAFERFVADGDEAGARTQLADQVWVRIDTGTGAREVRDLDAVDDLLAVLAEHRAARISIRSGEVHVSPYGVTTIATYELADGTRWTRTLVYHLRHSRVTHVGLYRYELG
jgi:hypothetical protein